MVGSRKYGRKEEGPRCHGSQGTLHRLVHYPATFPTVRMKDVLCMFCRTRFYISRDLKGNKSPLLLPCGHASCSNCESENPSRHCLYCPKSNKNEMEKRKNLPYNAYVIGLLHTLNSALINVVDDKDIGAFHVSMNSIAPQNFDQGCCSECGIIANYDCKKCDVLFCRMCFKKIHGKALQDHTPICLRKDSINFTIDVCPNHETEEPTDYFCQDCNFNGCSHCIIKDHNGHTTLSNKDRNHALIPELKKATMKLKKTRAWIQQTKMNLTNNMVCTKTTQELDKLESLMTQHFIQLHGALQNLEQQLKNKIQNQRKDMRADIEKHRTELHQLDEKMASLLSVAVHAEYNYSQMNVKSIIEKLNEFVNTPCHIVKKDDQESQIKMVINEAVFNNIQTHVELQVPDIAKFQLMRTEDLPEGYQLEPLLDNETISSSFKTLDSRQSFAESTSSHSSSFISPNDSIVLEVNSEKGNTDKVIVTHVINPTNFYVQKVIAQRELQEIELNIAQCIENEPKIPEHVKLNGVYLVQSSNDLKWYRGRVTEMQEANEATPETKTIYTVFYIDYGITDSGVTIERIRSPSVSMILPGLALHCTLNEIVSRNGDWDDNVNETFKSMVSGCRLTMKIIKPSNLICIVDLLKFYNNQTMLSVRDWLIDSQLAKNMSYYKLKRMNPLSAQVFYSDNLTLNKYISVNVSYIENPSCIYVQRIEVKEFKESAQLFYKQYSEFLQRNRHQLVIKNPEYGTAVALASGSIWQRGMITKILPKITQVEVFLVDIGSTVTVNTSQITKLPPRFCKSSAQAIKVSLIDIKPIIDNEWSTDAISYLKGNIEGKVVKVFPFSKTEDTYNVCIYVHNDVNVNNSLVVMKYAESTGARSFRANQTLTKEAKISKKARKKLLKKESTLYKVQEENESVLHHSKEKMVQDEDPYKVQIFIRKVISPDAIYASETLNSNAYEDLSSEMQTFYESNACNFKFELQTNKYYCVYSPKDKKYCRAQFLEKVGSDCSLAKMSLIDIAEVEIIPRMMIQPLDIRFLDLPKHIFKLKLAGIKPCGGSQDWQSSSCEKLKDIISETSDVKYFITSIGELKANETIPVELFIRRNIYAGPIEPNRKETISVTRILINEGLAIPIRDFFKMNQNGLGVELKKKLYLEGSLGFIAIKHILTSDETLIETESEFSIHKNDVMESEKLSDSEELKEKSLTDTSNESTRRPPKINHWLPAANIWQSEFETEITYVDYDCNIYFHPRIKECENMLENISNRLNQHYNNRSIKKYDHIWEKGELCIAKYHVDGKWYRGKVLQVIDHQIVKVELVDYGNSEDCQIGTIKKRIMLEDIPVQCHKASISGIKPIASKWTESELDIIHKAVVDPKKSKIKILNRLSNPWKAAVYVLENSQWCSLPWYLKNRTQLDCIIDEIDYSDDAEISNNNLTQENSTMDKLNLKQSLKVEFNNNDSHDSSSVNDSSLEDGEKNQEYTVVLRNDTNFDSEITLQLNQCNLSSDINNSLRSSSSKQSSSNHDSFKLSNKNLGFDSDNNSLHNPVDQTNGNADIDFKVDMNNDIYEKLLSGNSLRLNLNNSFDIGSVRSENLNHNENIDNLYSSTPMHSFLEENSDNDIPKYIDFSKYHCTSFQMAIGQAFSETKMTGYLINTANEELNKWIALCSQLQESIQATAKNQPLYESALDGQYCIALYKDGIWYRACIHKKSPAEVGVEIHVEFLDFGNRMMITDFSHIRRIKREWLDYPWMSFHFDLDNIRVIPERQIEASKALTTVMEQTETFTALIKDYETLKLELYLDEDCKQLVYASLLKDGLFEYIESEVD